MLIISSSTVAFGTIGYRLIEGWPWIDSLYMVVITITTVGFGEIYPLSIGGKVFTIFLICLGLVGITYAIRTITDYVIVGELGGLWEERRMKREIASLKDHFIICDYGRLGHEVCLELRRAGRDLVVVDTSESSIEHARQEEFPVVVGDAGLDAVLMESGVDRAAGLVACCDDDARNLLVVLSARALNSGLTIEARVSSDDASDKFLRAGANRIFLPYKTGGRRLAQGFLQPELANFLDVVSYGARELGLILESFVVGENSRLDGHNLQETRLHKATGAFVVGLKRRDTGIVADLKTSTIFSAGDTVIGLGTREQLKMLADYFTPRVT